MKLNVDNISAQNACKIAKDILEQENKKYDLNLSLNLLEFESYYTSDLFKKKFKLYKGKNKLRTLLLPFLVKGEYSSIQHREYVLFFSDTTIFGSFLTGKSILSDLLVTCYHEITHAKQLGTSNQQHDYRYFENTTIFPMEKAILENNYSFYLKHHDSFYIEIDANLKGTRMSIEYLNTNYPNSYKKDKEILYKKSILYEYQLKNYNFNFFLERIYNIYSKNYQEFWERIPFPNTIPAFSLAFPSCFCLPGSTQFKSVKEIMRDYEDWINPHKNFWSQDFQITEEDEKEYFESIANFLTSDLYLNQLDLNNLSDEEKKFLDLACLYSINKEREREKFNNSVKALPFILVDKPFNNLYYNMKDNQRRLKKLYDVVKCLDVNSLDDKSTKKGTLH